MKVLITVPRLALPGGVANYYRTLRPLLDADKIYFEVGASPADSGFVGRLQRLLGDYWRFFQLLRRHRIDLVHLNPSLVPHALPRDAIFLLLAKLRRLPVIVFFRGWDKATEHRIRQRWVALFRGVYGRADAFIVLANEFASTLRELGLRAPVQIETTVVADTVFEQAPEPDASRAGHCDILFLSRLDRGKGLLEAIDAVALLSRQFPDISLTVAGDGPERAAGETRAREAGLADIRFLGHVEGAAWADAYHQADVFLFPTFYGEGMPNAVLEAMAFGLPVVTRSVGGLRDFFEDGRMGYLTASQDPAVYADLLARLVTDPARCRAMGDYNREYARRRFSAPVVAARLLAIYDQVAATAAPR